MMPQVAVIIVAGGSGTRMQSALPKQYLPLGGKPVAFYSLEVFAAHPQVVEIVVVCDPDYRSLFAESFPQVSFASPGFRRQDSMENGFRQLQSSAEIICVHDAARPFIDATMLTNVIQQAHQHGAATVGMPVKYTVKQADHEGFVGHTPDRSLVWEIQTPQALQKGLLKKGLEKVQREKLQVTDDVSLVELMGLPVKLVPGSYSNLKITTPDDLAFAEFFLSKTYT